MNLEDSRLWGSKGHSPPENSRGKDKRAKDNRRKLKNHKSKPSTSTHERERERERERKRERECGGVEIDDDECRKRLLEREGGEGAQGGGKGEVVGLSTS